LKDYFVEKEAILNMDNPETQETLRIRHRTNTNNTKKNTTPNIKKDKHHGNHRKQI
jgi:hypothetical protein